MDSLHKGKPTLQSKQTPITDGARDLLDESRKIANDLYEEGLKKVGATPQDIQAYSDEVIDAVRKNPLKSVLIAGGVGFLLAALLKK